jgi:hypothetical protein
MRTFVRARVASKPEFVRSSGGVGVCRIPVIGDGNLTTSPPRLSLYVRDGGGKLNPEEARRCAFGLRPGDVIQAVGAVGAERPKARHQEVVVDEPVKLRARAAGTVGAA